ncbi:hypothetical protein THASP1DRAFT_18904 [Thamnocephalis sphaerospora]|uniref:Transmembrane protein 135 N-terminal domain-containing protein n=1 Tax=Thamnocephalis sphaerospora TaxID=78915 RepID=A0A4P9XJZ2_9FUNG|nr:hypothetical protein THASP1DRAFT_18904 [Thamnocephalis sphaerospora]|eukprot:RKP06104.1 hypothetical protein THASP1DRAFT_18904 [Thamnocephalis sphaerospora]
MHHDYTMCALKHPWTESCAQHGLQTFLAELGRSAKLYLPLNVTMTLLHARKRILTDPLPQLRRIAKSTFRSSMFLSSYVVLCFLLPCALRRTFKREHTLFYVANGLAAGFCATIDAPGRRLELGMYCLTRALEILWNGGILKGWWRSIPHGEVAYFALGLGAFMSVYQTSPMTIPSGYRSVMTRFFGVN